jgi:uncharacterized protein
VWFVQLASAKPDASEQTTRKSVNPRADRDQTVPMSMKEQLRTDLTTAMKAREAMEVATLRMVLAAVMNAEVAGDAAVALSDEEVMTVMRKEAKKRVEAAEAFALAGRTESAEKERGELAVIERYLPAAMDDAALQTIVTEEVASSGATSAKDMGNVVKAVRARVGGQADGAKIAAMVKAALS